MLVVTSLSNYRSNLQPTILSVTDILSSHQALMIRELKVPRVVPSAATSAVKWSKDGQLAILAGVSVVILVSLIWL